MSTHREFRPGLAIGLAAAILANILVAWTLRYWPTAVGITGISLVAAAWAFSGLRIRLPLEMAVVCLVACWGPAQLIVHSSVLPSVTVVNSLSWIAYAVTFFLASQLLREKENREIFLRVMLWAGVGLGVLAMLQASMVPVKVFGIIPVDPSVVGTIHYKNHFAALMELIAPIALWEVRKGKIAAGGIAYAILVAATITSLSRAGTIGILSELVLFAAIMVFSRQWQMRTALGVTGALVLLVVAASLVTGTRALWDRMEESNPYAMRGAVARSTVEMVSERPWLGFGLGTWPPSYTRFARLDNGLVMNEAHNDLLQWAAEGGIPFFVLMAALVCWLGGRLYRSVWGLGVLVVFAHCYVDYALRRPPVAFLWFALAGAVTAAEVTRPRERNIPKLS